MIRGFILEYREATHDAAHTPLPGVRRGSYRVYKRYATADDDAVGDIQKLLPGSEH